MNTVRIPLTRPWTEKDEREALLGVLDSGWLTQGERVSAFEAAVAEYVGFKHAVAFSSCTTALHIGLLLLGVGPGDEVIVPSYTWIATANAVRYVGAQPIFADIELDTFNISASTIAELITDRTRAVIPVHQFGMPAPMAGICSFAEKAGIAVLEDAACALGSLYMGSHVGRPENVCCYSFHPRKVITTGEGGMLVTNSSEQAERARRLINHGASVSDLSKDKSATVHGLQSEEFPELGFNYRMTNLQGALGLAQMGRLDDILAKRAERADRYTEAFSGSSSIVPPFVPEYARPNWQSYVIRISEGCPTPRDAVAQRLLNAGIACRPGYMACHSQPLYQRMYPGLQLPVTDRALKSVLILPLYPQMTDSEQDYVVEKVLRSVLPE